MTLSATVWAMDQQCETPLEKLCLLYLADVIGEGGRWQVTPAKLEAFCCASEFDVGDAIIALHDNAKIIYFGLVDGKYDIAFPWYVPERSGRVRLETRPRPAYTRASLLEKQDGKCWYCACDLSADPRVEPYCQLEHQHPRSRGGECTDDNIVLACRPCNIRKKDKTVEEFRAWLEARDGGAVVFHGERAQ